MSKSTIQRTFQKHRYITPSNYVPQYCRKCLKTKVFMGYGVSFRNHVTKHRLPLAAQFCISVSERPCSTKPCSRRPAFAWCEAEDEHAPSLPPALRKCPGQKHSWSTPHSCSEQWQNRVPHLPLEPTFSSPQDSSSNLPFPFSPGQAVFDLTCWRLSWAFLMQICAPQHLASEGQVRCLFAWAAVLSLTLFPLQDANKAAIPTL